MRMAKVIKTMMNLLQNPSGPYSAYFARRDLTIQNLNERFRKMINDKKKFTLERYSDKDDFIFYFKVPSETYNDLFYDVVIKFSPINDQAKNDMTLNNYSVELFSNAANFVFTYAYAYNENEILIEFLKDKISERALNEPPNIRNPIKSFGFEKSVYFALLYIREQRYNVKSKARVNMKPLSKTRLKKEIMDSEDKMKQYNRIKKREEDKKREEKRVAKQSKTSYNESRSLVSKKPNGNSRKPSTGNKRVMKHSTAKSMKRDMTLKGRSKRK
jgi:hypothetical protein